MRRMINANSRTKKVYLNSIVALLTQILQVILGFVVRKVFINSLGVMYLGYNSVFSNILQMLNLADLGIGVAITSFLYKPLADKDNDRVCALMYMYKKVYRIMGLMVLIAGLIVLTFIEVLIPDAECSLWYLRVLFLINLSGAVSTYFFAYKRTLIIADQKSYIANVTDTTMFFVISTVQIIVLAIAPNYIIYLILNIAKNIISNVILSIKSYKILGDFNAEPEKSLVDEYKPQIIRYIKDLFISRTGATIFYGTDNVIISIFKGSILAGYLSNYTMITSQLTTVINQVFSAVQATYGNYISSNKSIDEQRKMTDNYFCVNFCIGNFCFVCFTLLVQPFVILFLGQQFLLSFSTAVWLGINLMLSMLIQLPSQVFTIYKLFRYDRPIIIVSAVLNIVISAVLVKRLGTNGVLIGTFVASLIYLFSRFFIISRYVFYISYVEYLRKIVVYFCISAISFIVTYFSVRNVTGETVVSFINRMIFVMAFSILITVAGLSFTDEFEFLTNKFVPIKFRMLTKRMILVAISFVLIIGIAIYNNIGISDVNVNQSNKSLNRTDSYESESDEGKKVFNLTFDDTITCFEDLNENEYDSIFDNDTLAWLKELHDDYGVVISMYVMYENGCFDLSQCSDLYKEEFIENSNWLRFGFHTLNGNTSYESRDILEDYKKTIKQLERIVGEESIDNVVRLQAFQGSYEGMQDIISADKQPVVGLLTADDDRQSYYLDADTNTYIYSHDELYDEEMGCYLFSTDLRAEYISNIDSKIKEFSTDSWNNQLGDLIVFSHEWALNLKVRENIEKLCEYAVDSGYRFVFLEEEINFCR